MLEFAPDLTVVGLVASDACAVIETLAGRLAARHCVSADYGAQTYARELEHPTGLPTRPYCIAFPHADAAGVTRSALAVAILSQPVTFQNMADPAEALPVEAVFLLANKRPEEQVSTLRRLAQLFGQPERLLALRAQSRPEAVTTWLKAELGLE